MRSSLLKSLYVKDKSQHYIKVQLHDPTKQEFDLVLVIVQPQHF